MPSIDVATMKARKATIAKIKTLATKFGISQLDLLDRAIDLLGETDGEVGAKKVPVAPKISPEEWVINHFNNKLWSMYFKEQPDELNLYRACDGLGQVVDIYSKPYKKVATKLIAYFTAKNKNVTLDTLHSDSLKINKG